jgi:hypothetical protein
MTKEIENINQVIEAYFKAHADTTIVPVKELMQEFIAAGVFKKDVKNGKPIRDVLKQLNKSNELAQIPYAHAMQNGDDTYWYFVPKDAERPTQLYKQEPISEERLELENKRLLSDKYYVMNLCDEALKQKAKRQKRFDFLVGDLHKDGKTRTQLPVDAFYHDLNLVIEFKEAPLAEPTSLLLCRILRFATLLVFPVIVNWSPNFLSIATKLVLYVGLETGSSILAKLPLS